MSEEATSSTQAESSASKSVQETTAKELAREFRWVEIAMLVVNAVLAVIGVIALCIYGGQLHTMQDQLNVMQSSIRPYVGISTIAKADGDNGTVILATIKNFGTTPAFEFVGTWNATINGVAVEEVRGPQQPFILFPGRPVSLQAQISKERWQRIDSGTDTLAFRAKIRYGFQENGPLVTSCEENAWNALAKAFSPQGCAP